MDATMLPMQSASHAHKVLNERVIDFIEDRVSADEMVSHIEVAKEILGVAAAKKASDTVKAVVTMRLRESVTDAIYHGKHKLTPERVRPLEHALKNAKSSGMLTEDVNLKDFHVLLANLDSRCRAMGDVDSASLEWLVDCLRVKTTPEDGETPVSDATLASICAGILRTARGNLEVCHQLMQLGFTGHARNILLVSPSKASDEVTPQYPDVQIALTLVLAEIALQCASEADRRQQEVVRSKVWDTKKPPPKMKMKTAFAEVASEPKQCLDILMSGFRAGVRWGEHSLIWATTRGLLHAAQNGKNKQHMLLDGIIPLLRKTIEFYQGVDDQMPLPKPRTVPPVVSRHSHPPEFIAFPRTNALEQGPQTAKERLMNPSRSLPVIDQRMSQGSHAVDWLAGTMRSSQSFSGSLSASWRPRARHHTLAQVKAHTAMPQRMAMTAPPLEQGTKAAEEAPPKPKYPSLMWVIAEDAIEQEAFYRCCNKSLLLIQARRLLRLMEDSGSKIASAFTGAARVKPK